MKKRKAQQEIVGFILIVVLVVVIGIFLLAFYLRKASAELPSTDVSNFLGASMLYTTKCIVNIEPLSIEELTKSCYKGEECQNDTACDILNNTLNQIIEESWKVSDDKPVNSYSMIIYYQETENATKEKILELKEGNCTGIKSGAGHIVSYSPGNIKTNLEICSISK